RRRAVIVRAREWTGKPLRCSGRVAPARPQLVRLTPSINTICCARRCRPRGRLKREAGADHGPIPALPRSGNGNEPVMALGRTSREAAAVGGARLRVLSPKTCRQPRQAHRVVTGPRVLGGGRPVPQGDPWGDARGACLRFP